ncbi:MAG: triosephosphate isomerase [Candidatus Zambryskibacteria bacterium]|nr:triosephosphate isomerase [Candidatus Zambryskibacteria bacterium]
MAKPILVANWKNYPKSLDEAEDLLKQLSRNSQLYKKVSLFIAPPLPYFESVSNRSKNFARLASQDIPDIFQGTHTGLTTPDILKSFGVRLAIIGHSERRALGETNEIISKKVKVALRSGIAPLVCIGESVRDADGEHFEFLRDELKSSLSGLRRKADILKLAVAYEPVWAVGKQAKSAIELADLSESVIFIRKVLTDMFGRSVAERIPILYGGSVEPGNAGVLARGAGIRGLLVGRASLSAKTFKAVAESLIKR